MSTAAEPAPLGSDFVADRVGLGIDFGTSNSVAAVFDGRRVTLVDLEDGGGDHPGASEHVDEIMPSATYIDRALQTLTGRDAIDQYIDDNTGRKVELIPEVIGKASLAVGNPGAGSRNPGETKTVDVYGDAMTDTGMRGRLFRGTKRLLGKADVRRLMVFDHPFRLVALITPLLLRMHNALVAQVGEVERACVGHPVNFEGRDEHRNKLALTRLGEAYRYAGIVQPRFYPEPIAAAVSFLHANPGAEGERLLTVDFGGGTLDFCVLERAPGSRFRVVTTHGIALGGDHIDQRLFARTAVPATGQGRTLAATGRKGASSTRCSRSRTTKNCW